MDSIRDSIEADNIYVAVSDEGQIIGTLTSVRVWHYIDQNGNLEKGMIIIGGWHSLTIGGERIRFDNGVTHEIRGVCVNTAYRNQGVAAALLEYALSEIQTRSYAFVWAPGGNIRAKALWESYGFKMQQVIKDIKAAVPAFCEGCAERQNGCDYCELYVYVENEKEGKFHD